MTGRRAAMGISVLCALSFSAIASSASAATSGTTAFTCAANSVAGAQKFSDAHCLTAASGNGGFKHVGFPNSTSVTSTNTNTASSTTAAAPSTFKGTITGIKTAITCTAVSGSGAVENMIQGEVHTALLLGLELTFTGCTVPEPAGRECVVKGGEIKTKSLSGTTNGTGKTIEIIGNGEEKLLASITIEKCKENKPPNMTYSTTGSVRIPLSGATLNSTHAEATTQGTLKFAGNVAGFEGSLTIKNAANGTPISFTDPPYTE